MPAGSIAHDGMIDPLICTNRPSAARHKFHGIEIFVPPWRGRAKLTTLASPKPVLGPKARTRRGGDAINVAERTQAPCFLPHATRDLQGDRRVHHAGTGSRLRSDASAANRYHPRTEHVLRDPVGQRGTLCPFSSTKTILSAGDDGSRADSSTTAAGTDGSWVGRGAQPVNHATMVSTMSNDEKFF
jgi:hypothetical protein